MADPWLCDAGTTLRNQINRRWPNRDTASDGWIGDAAHCPGTSDHCPDPATGVVRAIDVDRDLARGDRTAMERLVGQLRRYCKDRKDHGRVAYIIFDGAIASRTHGWTWRPYNGANPHDKHCHVSFTEGGDHRGGMFGLPIFTAPHRQRLTKLIDRLNDRIDLLARRRAKARRTLESLRG
jgi:hypothetical protein